MKNLSSVSRKNAENGFVLVTSLIFLVVITLLAVSAISSSTLQERMAANLRDKSHARQDADAALRRAEYQMKALYNYKHCYSGDAQTAETNSNPMQAELRIWCKNKIFDGSVKNLSAAFLDPTVWTNPKIQSYPAETDRQPAQFFVEESKFRCRVLDAAICARGDGTATYRITARAHGANPAAIAVTQSVYEKQY